VTGYEGNVVEDILFNVAQTTYERNMVQANILKAMAQTAPAFGMIGTLVGLIIMLDGMGRDPTQLGKGLAVALNTSLYGVLFSRLILTPASTKIQQR
jgi:chemotaxis protein MotA